MVSIMKAIHRRNYKNIVFITLILILLVLFIIFNDYCFTSIDKLLFMLFTMEIPIIQILAFVIGGSLLLWKAIFQYKSKLSNIVKGTLIGTSFLLSLLLLYILFGVPKKPIQNSYDITNLPPGNIGFRAWGCQVSIKNISVISIDSTGKNTILRPVEEFPDKWRKVWVSELPENDAGYGQIENGFNLKNCGVILDGSSILHLEGFEFGRIDADISFDKIDSLIEYPGFQFCIRVENAKAEKNGKSISSDTFSEDYIAFELPYKKPWWSKCYLPYRGLQPRYYENFYDKVESLIQLNLYKKIKIGHFFHLSLIVQEDNHVLFQIIDSKVGVRSLYEGRLNVEKVNRYTANLAR